ncbi:MAG TPA: pentapeptide repeat-containing protein, partial [Synechococcales bacterium UBA12195]|nr:pentapeptide repeat-containing protein [Synechococcales bacterium UBA12195]
GSNFAGADLSDVLMDRADFTGTNLSGTNLSGVVANGSSFAKAEIEGADFTGALLDRDDQITLCRKAKGETRLSLDCP